MIKAEAGLKYDEIGTKVGEASSPLCGSRQTTSTEIGTTRLRNHTR